MNKPTINEMMERTLSIYGYACRMWGQAIADKNHPARRKWATEATRNQTLMHHLISMIKTAPNLGEDITEDTPGCPHCGLITCNGVCPAALKDKPDVENTEEVESD